MVVVKPKNMNLKINKTLSASFHVWKVKATANNEPLKNRIATSKFLLRIHEMNEMFLALLKTSRMNFIAVQI